MTYKSIKLLALAVIYGSALIGFALVPFTGANLREFVMPAVLLVSGIWFLIYWTLCEEPKK